MEDLIKELESKVVSFTYPTAFDVHKYVKLNDVKKLLEALSIGNVVKPLKGVDKIPFDEWKNKTFYKTGTNRFELKANTSIIYSMDEIFKAYNSF